MRYIFISIILIIGIFSCSDSDSSDITISEYLEKNNIQAEYHDSGIYYVIEKLGTGGHPDSKSLITAHYRGYYLDDEQFDTSYGDDPIEFKINSVIKGWKFGIPLFQKGGKGKLFIPPHLGYASNPPPGIRTDAPLVFDIEVIDFQ